jgi:hypothetical protein
MLQPTEIKRQKDVAYFLEKSNVIWVKSYIEKIQALI